MNPVDLSLKISLRSIMHLVFGLTFLDAEGIFD